MSPLRWAIAMILALVCAAGAEIINTASVEFKAKSFVSPNIKGEPLVTATFWADPDTMPNISLRVVVAEAVDSTHVNLNVSITLGNHTAKKNLTDISTDAELWLPDSTWGRGILDSLFSVTLTDTRPLVKGEEFRLEIKDRLVGGLVVTEHPLRLLTIKTTSDTLDCATGAVATDWFRVEKENINILTQLNTVHADTAAQIAIAYQMSLDGITALLPLDEVVTFKDSCHLLDNDITGTRGRWNEYWFSRGIGKYMRILYYGVNTDGRVSVDSVAVLMTN